MADYDVVVIGAGCGGLSAGAQLAAHSRKVLVLEQSSLIGGCCSTYEQGGYRFDLGASIIESADLIDRAFKRLGTSFWDEVDLIPCDPAYTVLLQDGTRLQYPISIEGTAAEIGKISPQDAGNFHRFARDMKEFGTHLQDLFVTPMLNTRDLVRFFAKRSELLKFAPFFASSYQDVMKSYFKDERIRESMAYQTLFLGLPPELCPGIFALIPYGEHEGLYYSRGGMIGIPAALQRCGEKSGMELRTNTRVAGVIVRNRRAMGVVLDDGTEISANIVVSDINARTLYLDLIGEEHLPWLARVGIKSYEYAMAVPMLYLGVDYEPPLQSHHTLATLPMEALNQFWWKDYKQGRFAADEQFGIISWTTGSDPGLAPKGHHVIILTLAPAPYRRSDGQNWDKVKPELTDQLVAYYDKHYIPGLVEHVQVAELATPLDFERRVGLPEGSIYAFRQDITNEIVFRPSARSKSIKGLYLVGASTHPGGGVPTTIASGTIAADLIAEYE